MTVTALMRSSVVFLACLASVLLGLHPIGCAPASQSKIVKWGDAYRLTPKELESLENAATNGDATAAWRIFLHYAHAEDNEEKGEYWLRKSAALGHKDAIATLKDFEEKRTRDSVSTNRIEVEYEVVPDPFGDRSGKREGER